MGLLRRGLLLLGGVAVLLVAGCCGSSFSHTLQYFYTAFSEPSQGLPQFIAVGYVDDQPITHYDSHTRRKVPQVPWMKEVKNDDPWYWETQSKILRNNEQLFRKELEMLRDRYGKKNSTGLHTWQLMYGCEVGPDGRLRGAHHQYGYDGEDFLALDKETLTWTASVPQAEISKRKLDTWLDRSQECKDYLEGTCVEWLRRYLGYGNETLQRTEAPTARVAHKKGYDGQETLFCQLYGFYPKEIEVTWMKDGDDRKPDTYTGGVLPNWDGTYHTWLSIEVDPKERDRYRCHVEHNSLPEPLDVAWEKPAPNLWLIVGIVWGLLLTALVQVGAGVTFYRRKWREKRYEAAFVKQPIKDGFETIPRISSPSSDSISSGDSNPGSEGSEKPLV